MKISLTFCNFKLEEAFEKVVSFLLRLFNLPDPDERAADSASQPPRWPCHRRRLLAGNPEVAGAGFNIFNILMDPPRGDGLSEAAGPAPLEPPHSGPPSAPVSSRSGSDPHIFIILLIS